MQLKGAGNGSEVSDLSFCFVCICQRGELETQSLLLFASLVGMLPMKHELVAAIPSPASVWGEISHDTKRQLAALGVRLEPVENDFGSEYPIGNKLGCLAVETTCDRVVFLDSDLLCMNEFRPDTIFDSPIAARIASAGIMGNDPERWRAAYRATDCSMSTRRHVTAVTREETPPYFNAGFVAVDRALGFSDEWRRCAALIDASPDVQEKRPWLDQIAMPVAAACLNVEIEECGNKYNYPPRAGRLRAEELPVFYHYNNAKVAATEPLVIERIRALGTSYPLIGKRLLEPTKSGWRDLVEPLERPQGNPLTVSDGRPSAIQRPIRDANSRLCLSRSNRDRNLIVTGIPRSGASLFNAILNAFDNAVCFNEMYPSLDFFTLFKTLRHKIQRGLPVENKFDVQGQVTTNTIASDTHIASQVFEVLDDRFLVAQKYTLRYLVNLERIVAEGWRVWCIVRNPIYALSSWARCPAEFPVTQLDPPSHWFGEVAFRGADEEDRRIDVWNHLASIIDRHRDRITLLRYEDLVADPAAVVSRLQTDFGLDDLVRMPEVDSRNAVSRYPVDSDFVARVKKDAHGHLFGYWARVVTP